MATFGTKIVDTGHWPLSINPEQKPLHSRGWICLHLMVKWGKGEKQQLRTNYLPNK